MNACAHCLTPVPSDGRYCSNCGRPSGEIATQVSSAEPTEELRKRLAATLEGRYEIVKLLGRGGMAVVFLANDLTLERQVAIKVLPPEMSHDTKLIPRFQQEAKTAAKLDHPNIIPIYRVESEAGLVYFVMKYVTGHSLDQLLDQGPVPFETARRILREAALALGHAHKRGIVHRDVKPANIMLEADGRVMLTDFGISKALDGGSALTGTGAIIGTPQYMAPEQAKGAAVDGRADQYSLGVVGHQLLTGKEPFEGSSHSILYKHVFEPPPRIFEARPDAPVDLCAALDRALSKEPEKRFASMEEFASAVSGERTGPETVVSAPVKPPSKAAKPRSGNEKRRKLIWGSAIAVGLCVAIGGASWAALRPPQALIVPPSVPKPVETSVTPPVIANQPRHLPLSSKPTPPIGSTNEPGPPPAAKPKPVKKEYALLTVASEPWGTLYLGNKEIGPTPIADYPLPLGTHRIRIEQEGYRTKMETIVVSEPTPIRRRYLLEPAGPP
ncbi:MAG TPA: protein kinase [Gemmatimonadales bacterium]|nr:protein kinase [Gemmatimonadales bacterium]